jgi:acyl-CoA thioester hydrolase
VFEIAIAVLESDIDELGHVNNVTYVRWIQEAAVAHWRALATPEERAAVLWIVVRHEIDYLRAGYREDKIVARTWVGAATRVRFERYTEILRAADGALLANARTIWVPVNAQSGKPVSVGSAMRARFSTGAPAAEKMNAPPKT